MKFTYLVIEIINDDINDQNILEINFKKLSVMKRKNLIFVLSAIFLVLQGCSRDGISDIPQNVNDDLKSLSLGQGMIRSGDAVDTEEVLINEGAVIVDAPTTVDNVEGVFIKKTRIYKAGLVYAEHLLFDPINSYLYPGLVFAGNSIVTGEYTPVPNQKLNPVTVTTSLTPEVPNGQSVSRRIENMRYSKYIDALKDWRAMKVKPSAASTEYEVTEYNSEKGFKGQLGVGYVEPTTGIGGEIELGSESMKKKNHVLVKFVQKLFSTSLDIPETGQILKEVNVRDLNFTMPVYISDIFYGRMAFAVISSNSDLTKLKAALSLSILDPHVKVGGEYSKILEESDVKAICIGGSPTQHGYIVADGWDGMKRFISEDIESSTAVPVSFILKYADDNSVARVFTTEQFPVLESYFIPKSSAVELSFRGIGLKAQAGLEKKMRVYGNSMLSLPENSPLSFSNDQKEFTLINIDKKNYVNVDRDADFAEIESLTGDVESSILRPDAMSMKAFLDQKLKFTTQFNNTDAYGNLPGASLGNRSTEISIKDLIFAAKHESLDLQVKDNRVIDHNATVRFRVGYKTVK